MLLCLAAASGLAAQEGTPVSGRVVDTKGAPVAFASVQVVGATDGAATDSGGAFRFLTTRTGNQRVRATLIGYRPAEAEVVLVPGRPVELSLTLAGAALELEPLRVTASTFSTGPEEGVSLSSLEVLATPGAAADIFRALQTFPGVGVIDDGAGLFVRGGDVDETVVLVDGARVAHPYKYESPTGGMFGTISPFLVSGTHFSTGAFGAEYGNALSGVLALESLGMPEQSSQTVSLGLAAASLGVDAVLGGRLGVRFSGNRSFTGLMFLLNGHGGDFEVVPQGWDANLSLILPYGSQGELKLFNFATADRVGVRVTEGAFAGTFRGSSSSTLHHLHWTDRLGAWEMEGGLAYGRFASHQRLGVLDLRPSDHSHQLHLATRRPFGARRGLRLGAQAERTASTFRGTFPATPGVFDPHAAVERISERAAEWRGGAWAELEAPLAPRLTAVAGVRADHHTAAGETVMDPRLSLAWSISGDTRARLAWGLYHQFPQPFEYLQAVPGRALRAPRAEHWVAGWEHRRPLLTVRVEAWLKRYRGLVLTDSAEDHLNAGAGRARGVDLFARFGEALRTPASGRIAYSWLRSERTQLRRLGAAQALEAGPSPFANAHNLSLVGNVQLSGALSLGMSYRFLTGRPFTPVVGAVPAAGGAYWLPLEGRPGSGRLPDFHRLDVQASRLVGLGEGRLLVLYAAVANVLDRRNVTGYDYSPDYAERIEQVTHFRRSLYFGGSLTLRRRGARTPSPGIER